MWKPQPLQTLLALTAALAVASSAEAADSAAASSPESPRLVAIKLHADWCGSCRKMGSVFEDLGTVMEDSPVLFVRLDLTDGASRSQAAYLMEMMGLGGVWRRYDSGKKTGLIAVVDTDTKKTVAALNADQNLKQMKAVLQETLEKTGG